MKKHWKAASTIVIGTLLLAACTNSSAPKESAQPTSAPAAQETQLPATAKPSQEPTAQAPETHQYQNFPTWGYDYQSNRHVPFTQITKDNVKDLGVIWEADLKKVDAELAAGNQSFSPVVDGVIYATGSYAHVFAYEAVSGKLLWNWKPDKEIMDHIKSMGMFGSNRGVAVGEGKVFVLITDDRLAALDQKTGQLVKMINLWDTIPDVTAEKGYYETVAPIYYKGNVYIGSSGADNGVRGFVMAYKASDLTPAWDQPFWTVPPKGQDWLKDSAYNGGGTVWDPPSIDPETDIMYFGTGNPAPDFYGAKRPGSNPYVDSVIALDSKTGKMIWARQEVSHDLWDYDAAATPMVLKAKVNGKERKVVVQGGKSGEWFCWDAATGEPIYKNVAFSKIDHPKPTPKGVLSYPGVLGGENYAPETYDPESNYVLIPGIESPSLIKAAKSEEDSMAESKKSGFFGALAFGTSMGEAPPNIKPYGTVTAIDMNTGKIAYQNKTDDPMRGGFTSTAAGIAFYGEQSGKMKAIDIKSGQILWDFQTSGGAIGSAPSIFTQDGKQYVAQTTGGPNPKLIVFGLGGENTQGASQQTGGTENVHQQK
ncbi:outer membrane protein assembly factor BamB family protein [Ferviditalea candida]|uniref:PQQ-binding-like beta-propeller repeat protein n=1 Tax=Ferviditalea candida TaxID=3108399 RepID=A0ABU5ZN71_9BACL|nr:PQQ-binding-like beta-propeller repeat protein [Paenibacillaceae bacterium T2]